MRLAVVQTNPVFGRNEVNIHSATERMRGTPADMYVLPELFNTGYNFTSLDEVDRVAEKADGATFRAMVGFAQRNSCYIAYGFAERADQIYNSAALVGPRGLLGVYRKVHLFDRESLYFNPGNLGFQVFDTPLGKIGLMICFDWMYPEAARSLALKGAHLIAHPSNLVMPYCPDGMVTRCLENRVFAATADRVGREDRGGIDIKFIGTSEIVSPKGEILARLGKLEEATAVVDVDLSAAAEKKINQHNDLLAGRRPDQYNL
jgi:predicted amidohydrolase